jgi:hypothetical protein
MPRVILLGDKRDVLILPHGWKWRVVKERPGGRGRFIEWSRRHMANHKVRRALEFLDELLLKANGNVKAALRERAAEQRNRTK